MEDTIKPSTPEQDIDTIRKVRGWMVDNFNLGDLIGTTDSEVIIGLLSELKDLRQTAMQIIKMSRCRVHHLGYKPNTTCLDKQEMALRGEGNLTDDFRRRLGAGEGLCDECAIVRELRPVKNEGR